MRLPLFVAKICSGGRRGGRKPTLAALVLATAISTAGRGQAPGGDLQIDFGVRMPMRDGVVLVGDVYRPRAPGRYPVILTRTPYNRNGEGLLRAARYFVSKGFVYVAQDVRGRGDSGGDWVPYRHEGRDGYDTIEWCARQSWSTGKVGTIGQSYTGYNQWMAAVEQPPHLAAMIVLATMTDPMGDVWISGPGGLPTPTMISWYHLTADNLNQNMNALDWEKLNWHLPLVTMDEAAGRPNPRWRDIINHSRLDQWWEPMRYQNKLDRVTVPVLHVSGWYDDALRATPMNFAGMRTGGGAPARDRQKLVIGPWPHQINSTSRLGEVDFGPSAIIDLQGLQARWFDRWLKDQPNGVESEPAVRLFAMGANRWLAGPDWPLPETRLVRYHLRSGGRANSLHGDGRLTLEPAPAGEPADRYRYDPASPTPFLTEPSFAQLGGPEDYRPVERRDDVLVYTAEPFAEETLVCGPLRAQVTAASSAPDTDFMVKLLDVWPNGFAQRLNDGMIRARFREGMDRPSPIEPGRAYAYQVDLWATCQAFLPGHRVRVEIASSAFPKFDRNPNTGDPLGMSARQVVADQQIFHEGPRQSWIELPIVPGWRAGRAER
jgi:putative CocE/NonD family hydrolase